MEKRPGNAPEEAPGEAQPGRLQDAMKGVPCRRRPEVRCEVREERRMQERGVRRKDVASAGAHAEEPDGAALASEYNITAAPTLIVQNGEKADLYGNVSNIRGFIHNIQ